MYYIIIVIIVVAIRTMNNVLMELVAQFVWVHANGCSYLHNSRSMRMYYEHAPRPVQFVIVHLSLIDEAKCNTKQKSIHNVELHDTFISA
jgi:hypothetical protein